MTTRMWKPHAATQTIVGAAGRNEYRPDFRGYIEAEPADVPALKAHGWGVVLTDSTGSPLTDPATGHPLTEAE